MANLKSEYKCALLLTIDLIGGKWKLRLLWHIIHGDNRFSLLRRAIPEITEKMLTTQLKELENSGMIVRWVDRGQVPVKVEYSVSGEYDSIIPIIDDLCNFTKEFAKKNKIYIPS
ncbi:winged helix-turn-helix transcriptional regulator [Diplocloster agilis]|uniref:Helix-turn-helix transcriptional regulator n=1 Tax=Diplocloster agilis TaxID=2850323 RepID=A0A949K089_9FIRM|nr:MULTISPECIES: helix-turn-helix domain-containing protein [Lachnospiraceae]MBU9737501.1 helix-turn-helix transcriptional regulator [Diplocloster agilis]MBU9744751.1 helix-turn-helix transcriptional regulator [Diplocloster agilis]MCU6734690.1 helix-turn-helix transcriptional regulator [Suonthocola fibrivorans]SCJ50165.1 Uncharacterized HTH-type transcriptional regulator ytcD [uncultured Clostridium sp.]